MCIRISLPITRSPSRIWLVMISDIYRGVRHEHKMDGWQLHRKPVVGVLRRRRAFLGDQILILTILVMDWVQLYVTRIGFILLGITGGSPVLVYLPKSSQQTLPMTIYHFNSMYGTQWELLFADLILCALPVLIFYMFAQKHLIAGMTAGAVKG